MTTPRKGETQEQCQERENVRRRERYATDPEYRERTLGRTLERKRERYATDPEYRERTLARKRRGYGGGLALVSASLRR
jgi:flagellum-specific peptidoglycan hydrolase FlgJ